MKIAVMSDVHQDIFRNSYNHVALDCDVVVCAGDLQEGGGIETLKNYEQEVVFVPGNHEYYGLNMENTRLKMRNEGVKYGVNVLDRNSVVINGVRFLGCTLWTDFKLNGDELRSMLIAKQYLNDFVMIDTNLGTFRPSDARDLFDQDIKWLESNLEEKFDGPTVVVTHHAPSYTSILEEFKWGQNNMLNPCYASRLDNFIAQLQPNLWIHGHTHGQFRYHIENTEVICHARGYDDYEKKYRPLIVEI